MEINKITIEDEEYPERLKQIEEPPEQLYYKGEWHPEIFEDCLAVVGSRQMTKYGERIATKLVSQIAAAGITIVSGFMYGIDATGQKACVEAGGTTVAVLPCGVDIVHPSHQEELYNKILEEDGLIVSEFEPGLEPAKWTYPKRNRIVVGLSQATMVVEAGLNSGSLISADFAQQFERKLFAVPGPLTSKVSKGTAKLLKAGANVVTKAKDIIDFYNKEAQQEQGQQKLKIKEKADNELQRKTIKLLQAEPMEPDRLARKLGISAAELGSALSTLELKGIVEKDEGKYYIY